MNSPINNILNENQLIIFYKVPHFSVVQYLLSVIGFYLLLIPSDDKSYQFLYPAKWGEFQYIYMEMHFQ